MAAAYRMVLTCYTVPSTAEAICLRGCYAMPATLPSYARATRCPVLTHCTVLSPCAMPGTDLACCAKILRACYAMPGTELGYGATPRGG
eukprot:2498234-Rhodomonas_salina.4